MCYIKSMSRCRADVPPARCSPPLPRCRLRRWPGRARAGPAAPAAAEAAAGHAGSRPWRQGSRRDRGFRHLREARRLRRGRGAAAPAAAERTVPGRADPRAGRVHPACTTGSPSPSAHGAALFVSMHADALLDPSVRGASVYTLSDTASDAQTADLARRENSADRFGGPSFRNLPPVVADILASLVRQETRVGSARMARAGGRRAASRRSGCCPTRRAMPASWSCAQPTFRACWSKWASCQTIKTKRRCVVQNTGRGLPGRCAGRSRRHLACRAPAARISRPARGRGRWVRTGEVRGPRPETAGRAGSKPAAPAAPKRRAACSA